MKKSKVQNFVPIRSRYCTAQSQKIFGHYHLDGFHVLNDGSRECYEFYGCYYHGCPTCFPDHSRVIRRKHRENGFHAVAHAYRGIISRETEMKKLLGFKDGFDKWITIWEHEYNDNLQEYRNIWVVK